MNGKWKNPDGTQKPCLKDGCDDPIRAQGLCSYHYHHFYYRATTGANRKRNTRRDLGGVNGE